MGGKESNDPSDLSIKENLVIAGNSLLPLVDSTFKNRFDENRDLLMGFKAAEEAERLLTENPQKAVTYLLTTIKKADTGAKMAHPFIGLRRMIYGSNSGETRPLINEGLTNNIFDRDLAMLKEKADILIEYWPFERDAICQIYCYLGELGYDVEDYTNSFRIKHVSGINQDSSGNMDQDTIFVGNSEATRYKKTETISSAGDRS